MRKMEKNMGKYILSIDQSTQGTKALLFDMRGALLCRADRPHRQIIDENGWVEHDPLEIYENTLRVVRDLVEKSGIDKEDIAALGISNQRETSLAWDRATGMPVYNTIVWQCSRGTAICEELKERGCAETVRLKTGIRLSPYFPAAKLAWIARNVEDVDARMRRGEICVGTIDSYLVYRLTNGRRHQTDYSNASRTQLLNIHTLKWDDELLAIFGIDVKCMPQITDSDGDYGETDFEGWLDHPIPIRSVLGDSHAALFGQGCLKAGMLKATYGTGSSVMMNIGETPVIGDGGVVTSLAWKIGGQVNYVLEGNINYTGAVITWLKETMQLISDPRETEELAGKASRSDHCYLVPAFSGLGAPYWDSRAEAAIVGMTRSTGRNEVARAALDCIAYQITDVVKAVEDSSGISIREIRVDGGPTRNGYLMQFQSDMLNIPLYISDAEELSGIGAAYAAGLVLGVYDAGVFGEIKRTFYTPNMQDAVRKEKYAGWKNAVRRVRWSSEAEIE